MLLNQRDRYPHSLFHRLLEVFKIAGHDNFKVLSHLLNIFIATIDLFVFQPTIPKDGNVF